MSEKFFAAWFAFCTLVSLAITGVFIWALIETVQWVTAQ